MKKTLKRISSILLTLCMVCGAAVAVLPVTASAETITADTAWYDNDKTPREYTLQNESELLGFAKLANATPDIGAFAGWTIKLARDMDLNPGWTASATLVSGGTSWINDNDDYFSGVFDGCGYTISGIYLNGGSSKNNQGFLVGLKGGTVQNLAIVNSYFNGKRTAAICPGSGGSAGDNTISNCYVDAIVVGADATSGILALNNVGTGEKFTVSGCVFAGTVSSSAKYVGGIVGNSNGKKTVIEDCINLGTVKGSSNVGGILGRAGAGDEVTRCINLGNVTYTAGDGLSGDILGNAKDSNSITFSKCYWTNASGKDRAFAQENSNPTINGTDSLFKVSVGELAGALKTDGTFTSWSKVENTFLMLPTYVATTFATELESVIDNYRLTLYVQKSNDETKLRFVGVIALTEEDLANYRNLSFDVTMNYNGKNYSTTVNTTKVYTSIMVDGASTPASTYGGNYFFVVEITGMDGVTATDAVFDVTAKVNPNGDAPTFSETVSYTWAKTAA